MRKIVVIGFLGTTTDAGSGAGRWERWRPTVSLCQQEDVLIHRLDLLYPPSQTRLLDQIRADIARVSPETQVVAHEMAMTDPWDFEEVYSALHDFVAGYPFDSESEDYLVHITTGTHVAQICWYLLTEARFLPGRLIQTSPPRKPSKGGMGDISIIDLDLSKYDRIAQRFAREAKLGREHLKSGIATRNAAFNHMIDEIEQVAIKSREPILLIGPTGAGKSHLARRIFELKQHRNQVAGDFVEINCATLRGDQAMSALFGHVKGAFTGAANARKGVLLQADGGHLFLDEIGELGLDEQAMLLRALEEKRFLPVGADREVKSDFQLIAGTNKDLLHEVQQGRFREDLFARLNLWTFRLPGLSERREDIEPNLDYELQRFAQSTGGKLVNFNKEAKEHFLRFAHSPQARWSSNFRDLNASVKRMATLATGGRINSTDVQREINRLEASWYLPKNNGDALLQQVLGERHQSLDLFDRSQLACVISTCRQSRSLSEAGRKLFSVSRLARNTTNDADRLRKYLAKFELSWEDIVE